MFLNKRNCLSFLIFKFHVINNNFNNFNNFKNNLINLKIIEIVDYLLYYHITIYNDI